jgi:hypothetical protein
MPPLYQKQFKWQDDLVHNVALLFMKKDWVIKEIVYHPLKFAKNRMEDEDDPRPIRIRYFATFVMKNGKSKAWIHKYEIIYRAYDRFKDLVAEYGYDTSTEELFKKAVRHIGYTKIFWIDNMWEKSLVTNESAKTS